ncbi:hypothetical protein [Thermospira aquatica]|uniref:CHAT domain-containing protein n=1 Tax=Thermospira aquatica TaxID=2828656 RepID=A0AAX3BFC8_9SPIR|nr:hypothetical protein [Thermospira aquatica]URA10985.1 hypothetical protein KDW03_04055 [Thermospira aquatica]
MNQSWRWWENTPGLSLSSHHDALLKRLENGPAKLLFYQKKEGYIRLIVEQEMFLWETYLSWERWRGFLAQISSLRQVSSLASDAKKLAFDIFCETFRLPQEFIHHGWLQIFTHGEIPLWFFPGGEDQALWEFFLPVAEKKVKNTSSRGLVVVDSTLGWSEAEKNLLFSLFQVDTVDVGFFSSILWEKTYRFLHVIAHGKDGKLFSNDKTFSLLPVVGEELCFFHCCEASPHTQSIVSHALAMGSQHVIATVESILDDGVLLEPILCFYRLLLQTNVRYAFHMTSLNFPYFAKVFRLFMPYRRLYTAHN